MLDHPDPDAALMLRVKRGDRGAFTELVGKWQQPLMNFVFGTLRDEIESAIPNASAINTPHAE